MNEYGFKVTGVCGHEVDFEAAIVARDAYWCPVCGVQYHVEQEPSKVLASGFVMPGQRTVVVDSQCLLPLRSAE